MKCKHCGAEAQAGWRVCSVCGTNLGRPRWLKVRCRECGRRVMAGLRVCPACGQLLRKSWRDEIGALVLVILLGLSLYGLWRYIGRRPVEALTAQPVAVGPSPSEGSGDMRLASASPTPEFSSTPSAPPTPRPTPLPTATPTGLSPTDTPQPTHTPVPPSATPTETRVPSATPTEASLPASATPTMTIAPPTPSPSATARPPTRTPTVTKVALLPAPKLIGPDNGQEFAGPDTHIWLSWESVGVLAEDEWYAVSLRYYANGAVQYSGTWTREVRWLVPQELYRKPDPAHPDYEWDVVVMKQTSTKPDGGREGVARSLPSEVRKFAWR